MSWIDIAIIALVVLMGTLGVFKGTKKSALALAAFLAAFVIAFLLTNVITELLLSVPVINKFVLGSNGFSLYTWIEQGLAPDAASSFLGEHFYKPIQEIVNSPALLDKGFYSGGFTPHQGLSLYLAYCAFAAIIGIGLFLVIRGLLTIVTVIIKSYFDKKKKSVAGRLCGFLIGMVRGCCWTLAVTIAFSAIGGLTFAGWIGNIEKEYEDSVLAKVFNSMSYSIKNTLFLPDEDAYQRIVELSGIRVTPDEPEGPNKPENPTPPSDETAKLRNEAYCNLMNLNYVDAAYTVDLTTGEIKFDATKELIDHAQFEVTGFDTVVKAIIDYNAAMGEKIKADDGIFKALDEATLENYNDILRYGEDSVYTVWNNVVYVMLHNYMLDVEDGKTLTSAVEIEKMQAKLNSQYAEITAALDGMIEKYGAITQFDKIALEYPDCVTL